MSPLYMRIVDAITEQIHTGQLQPGQELPSISQLAKQYGLSQSTVKTGLAILRAQGLIYGVQGKGMYAGNVPD